MWYYGSNGECPGNDRLDQIMICHGYTAVVFCFALFVQVLSQNAAKCSPIVWSHVGVMEVVAKDLGGCNRS